MGRVEGMMDRVPKYERKGVAVRPDNTLCGPSHLSSSGAERSRS